MRPAARIAAAIELLELIDTAMQSGGAAADRLMTGYYRGRRYIGSKDRRAISAMVYGTLRDWALAGYLANRAGLQAVPRARLIAWAAGAELDMASFADAGSAYSSPALSDAERALWHEAVHIHRETLPLPVRHNLPDWVVDEISHALPADELEAACAGFNQSPALDIRLNPLVCIDLPPEIVAAAPLPDLPYGRRLPAGERLDQTAAYRAGAFEIQDMASQTAAALVAAEAGMQVLDFCAGAGGKSLAVAAAMGGKGVITALDISARRLAALRRRAERARARCITAFPLPPAGAEREAFLLPHRARYDRVIVDAPCSGSGTWRRNPDQRWRVNAAALDDFAALQLRLLREAAACVRPGGHLIYMTCSVFARENRGVVDAFLAHAPGFEPLPCRQTWPHRDACDGFFTAIVQAETK